MQKCSTVLSNKKIFIYNLCFGLSKLYTNIQQVQKAKLDYHMSMFVYMAGGEGWGLEVLKCFIRGVNFFSTCFVCVCVCVFGGGGGGTCEWAAPCKLVSYSICE